MGVGSLLQIIMKSKCVINRFHYLSENGEFFGQTEKGLNMCVFWEEKKTTSVYQHFVKWPVWFISFS